MAKKAKKKPSQKKKNQQKRRENKKQEETQEKDDIIENVESEEVDMDTEEQTPQLESESVTQVVGDEDEESEKITAEEEKETEVLEEKKDDSKEEEEEAATEDPLIPPNLESSLLLFTESQQALALSLCSEEANQRHLFERWPAPSKTKSPSAEASNNVKRRMMNQLEEMDKSYPDGGLLGYISNAKKLLDQSRRGVNPLDGWKPSVPQGENIDIGTGEYDKFEKVGLDEVGKCGFVLVAGGLGERLGYGDIKIGLPTELATETSYLQFFIQTILAYQKKYAANGVKLPLCIMTSNLTNDKTLDLLGKNDYFGMDKDQIFVVQQGQGVPALENNDAKISLDPFDRYKVSAKPHGHGDIHALIHSHGIGQKWVDMGIKWAIFFQDTNGLAFHTLPAALGVSRKHNFVMNSIATPRRAKQAIGGIALLTNENGEKKTINVEYNQLDPLLRSSGFPDGDENDPTTGYSPFPGNINQLLFQLEPYVDTLKETKGVMPEFVNPKYKDPEKTIFKKPTRLECMMQDFPTVLSGEKAERVGFTSLPASICFSPVKNTISDGVALQKKGTSPAVAASGESDQYSAFRNMMRSVGCHVKDASPVQFSGIEVVPGPQVVIKPDSAVSLSELKSKFTHPEKVVISERSSLVVDGSGVVIESLDLDGALVIECEEGATGGVINNLVVKNKGWEYDTTESKDDNEIIKMRGYKLQKIETKKIVFKRDGTVEGLDNDFVVIASPPAVSRDLDLSSPVAPDQDSENEKCGCVVM